MSGVPVPPIITCKQWGARKPKAPPIVTGKPNKIIEHHTDSNAGHEHVKINQRVADAIAFARLIQNYHMDVNGWNDTGQSFTVTRSGLILQGRWGTVTAIEHGRMVMSAHCPGQNDQPGIEHEHMPGQLLTAEQLAATVALQAWICDRCIIRPTELYGHRQFYNTDCPDNLMQDIPALRLDVARYLNRYNRRDSRSSRAFFVRRAVRRELSR